MAAGTCRVVAAAGKGRLHLRDADRDLKDRLLWRWPRGTATLKSDFGDPINMTEYEFCLYGYTGGVPELVMSHRVPAGAGWRENKKGFIFGASQERQPDGIGHIRLHAGVSKRARISIVGRGPLLRMATLPAPQDPTVVAQLSNGSVCWETTFSTNVRNDDHRFRARSDP